MPAILLLTGPSAGLRYDVVTEATLGRSPSCEIPLEDHKVSRRHAKMVFEDGQTKISDLGSRNGTVVNGEKIEAEAILLPGDRVQVGETTILIAPPTHAAFSERETGELQSALVEEVLPRVGPQAALYSTSVALLSATSEAMVLRRCAQEVLRSLNADRAAALLGGPEGLLTAAVVGADAVEVPRSLVRAAMERREAAHAGGAAVAPLAGSGGAPFGLLYVERPQAFTDEDARVLACLGRLCGEAYSAVRASDERERPEVTLVGSSRPFRKTVEQARRAAAGAEPVVLHGEAGAGKTLCAWYIHTRSTRALGPLVEVDCQRSHAEVDEALFGRASGPGVPPSPSALLRADGGTLLLRHVQSLPRASADRLARYLQKKQAPQQGGGEEPVDLRVIATAVSPVDALVSRGELSAELGQALGGASIELIPLRDRRPDVPALFEHFAQRAPRPGRKEPPTLSPDARRLLTDYGWPGNARELRLVTELLSQLHAGAELTALMLPPEIQEGTPAATQAARSLQAMIQRLERDAISEALREARGKKIKAAALLGISRPTLDKKIEDYGLVVDKRRG
jgi:DNA-binding NtrC family response regulator/pSer/pThr/pTyr-binding forkhead associated (FHA) protein